MPQQRMYPRQFPALKTTDQVLQDFRQLVVTDPLMKALWLLAMEQVAVEQDGAVPYPDIRPVEVMEQQTLAWLRNSLETTGTAPMEQLLAYVRFKAPTFAAWVGRFLR